MFLRMCLKLKICLEKDMRIDDYNSLIFDCDGVILDSNNIKTEAFETVFKPFGSDIAKKMVQYHIDYGGISRYEKIDYFLENFIEIKDEFFLKNLKYDLLKNFGEIVKNQLLKSEVCLNLELLKLKTKNSKWFIVSGGDEKELKNTFKLKKISPLFNGGIFGSPLNKYEIIENKIKNKNIKEPVIYFGDSKLDYEVADFFNFDFVFVYQWTEFDNWKSFFKNKTNVQIVNSPAEIITY